MGSTAPKPFVFVLMPFGPEFDDVYHLGIKAACQEAGTYCERLDEQIFHENMLERIYNQISKADIVVADMSGRNPNVFYEVGYAHALNKIVLLLTSNADDIPFDLKHYPHLVYSGKIKTLKDALAIKISWFLQSGLTKNFEAAADFVIYINDTLAEDGKTYKTRHKKDSTQYFDFKIHNISNRTFDSEDYKICWTTPREITINRAWHFGRDILFNNDRIQYYSFDSKIFPDQWKHCEMAVAPASEDYILDNHYDIFFSLLTDKYAHKIAFSLTIDGNLADVPF